MGGSNVYLYVPNLIGYARVLLCGMFLFLAFHEPEKAFLCYLFGQGLDAVDGVAARHLNQISTLGTVLDMITDRMGTAGMMVVLSHRFGNAWGFFTFLLILDIASHWCQMYGSLASGKASHKGGENYLLNFYYSHPTLFITCCGNEFFFMVLFLMSYGSGSVLTILGFRIGLYRLLAYIFFPLFAFKNAMNVVQLVDAVRLIVRLDEGKKKENKQ